MKKTNLIEEDILTLILTGAMEPGEKLPSIRSQAKRYNVSLSPVTDAYTSLVAKGFIESRPQSGFFVCNKQPEQSENMDPLGAIINQHRQLSHNVSERYGLIDDFISGYSQIIINTNHAVDYCFGTTSTSSRLYPELDFNMCLSQSFRNVKNGGNFQVMLHDSLRLKKNIVRWMSQCKCKTNIDDISIVRSVTEGLMLGIRACVNPGELVAIEAPGHAGFYFAAKFFNCRILPVPSNTVTGLDVDFFAKQLDQGLRPKCLILSASFSNPTGASMSDEDKERLVHLCADHDIPIIEDDILGELYFTDQRPRPLKSFDNENVIYISGFGKCISPETRMAYVAAGRYKEQFAFHKHLTTAYVHLKLQDGMAEFLENGMAEKYVHFFRKCLKMNLDRYREAILNTFPKGTSVELPKGGPYLWVSLPGGINSARFGEKARNRGITIAPSHLFNAPADMNRCFRFNCAAIVPSDESLHAVKELGALASSLYKPKK